jgi:hypothetical protein
VRRRQNTRRRRVVWTLAGGGALAVAVVVGIVAVSGGDGDATPVDGGTPASIEPGPSFADSAEQARALADWIRAHSD